MVRTKEGGSVLSFVIIGIVMIALLVGGVYVVKQQLTASETPPAAPQQPEPEEKKQPEAPKEQDKKVSENNQKADESKPVSSVGKSSELPQTGPAELPLAVVALGLLSLTAVSYARSRRLELSL